MSYVPPTIQVFVPRPLDGPLVDDGVTPGRWLAGYRVRFLTCKRVLEVMHQTTVDAAPTKETINFSYREDITTRYLCTVPRSLGSYNNVQYFGYNTVFQYDRIETLLTEPIQRLLQAPPPSKSLWTLYDPYSIPETTPGSAGLHSFLDAALFGLPPNTRVTIADQGPYTPPYFNMEPGDEFTTLADVGTAGALVVQTGYKAGDTGNMLTNPSLSNLRGSDYLLTYGTALREVQYGFQVVYALRTSARSVTYEYGEEVPYSIALMPRRQEPLVVEAKVNKGYSSTPYYNIDGGVNIANAGNYAPYAINIPIIRTLKHFNYSYPIPPYSPDKCPDSTEQDQDANIFLQTWSSNAESVGTIITERWGNFDTVSSEGYSQYQPVQFGGSPAVTYDSRTMEFPGFPWVNGLPVPYPKNWVAWHNLGKGYQSFIIAGWNNPFYAVYDPNKEKRTIGPFYNGDVVRILGWSKIDPFFQGGSVDYQTPLIGANGPLTRYDIDTLHARPNGYPETNYFANYRREIYKEDNGQGIPTCFNEDIIDNCHGFYPDAAQVNTGPGFPTVPKTYLYFSGTISVWIVDSSSSYAIPDNGTLRNTFTLDDGRKAFWAYSQTATERVYDAADPLQAASDTAPPAGKVFAGWDAEHDIELEGGGKIPTYAGPHYATGPQKLFICANSDITQALILSRFDAVTGLMTVDDSNLHIGVASPEVGRVGVLVLNGRNGPVPIRLYDRPQKYLPSVQPPSFLQ